MADYIILDEWPDENYTGLTLEEVRNPQPFPWNPDAVDEPQPNFIDAYNEMVQILRTTKVPTDFVPPPGYDPARGNRMDRRRDNKRAGKLANGQPKRSQK